MKDIRTRFLLVFVALFVLLGASGNLSWNQFRPATIHGNGSFGQASDGTGTPGHVAKYDAGGNLTDGGTTTGINFSDSEVPSGTIDGSNTSFTLVHPPVSASLHLYLNGLRETPSNDYTISGSTITMINVPMSGDTLLADYRF